MAAPVQRRHGHFLSQSLLGYCADGDSLPGYMGRYIPGTSANTSYDIGLTRILILRSREFDPSFEPSGTLTSDFACSCHIGVFIGSVLECLGMFTAAGKPHTYPQLLRPKFCLGFNTYRIWALYRKRRYTLPVLFLSLYSPCINAVRPVHFLCRRIRTEESHPLPEYTPVHVLPAQGSRHYVSSSATDRWLPNCL